MIITWKNMENYNTVTSYLSNKTKISFSLEMLMDIKYTAYYVMFSFT